MWVRERGADYLDGAIQAAPSQMGRSDTPILVSGAETAFRQSESLLKVLGGNLTYLGEQIGSAAAMDLATLSYIYGAILGFYHGARICEAEGFRVVSSAEHRDLVCWASDCAERVLPLFNEHSSDARPHYAIERARAWAVTKERYALNLSVVAVVEKMSVGVRD